MNVKDFSKPLDANKLNETLAKQFGLQLDLKSFTNEQLYDARNKLRTRITQIQTSESYNNVLSDKYQKNSLFLKVINAEIQEREHMCESVKLTETYKVVATTSNNKKFNSKTFTDKKSALDYMWKLNEAVNKKSGKKTYKNVELVTESVKLIENEENKAEIVMAAKDMVERIAGWMEDTNEMLTNTIIELSDAIRDEFGNEQASSFTTTIRQSLEQLFSILEQTRTTVDSNIRTLVGEDAETMGVPDQTVEPEMEPTVDSEPVPSPEGEETFAPAQANAGGNEESGRSKRESKRNTNKPIVEKTIRTGSASEKLRTDEVKKKIM